ncbi:hypothetical protein [Pseudomonas phage Alpheus]|uniref:Uncharacterized protein n=1 Tax=Pseudomonas phage Alpheus TaxID=2163983 RepID=A0A2S1GMX8_9CAUD|nr:hypothetical protein HOT11_gp11 [Pseudomonas phage Alpheus]AWD90735.1 hypothetical protein [Pseudomonas phage Alpheus]
MQLIAELCLPQEAGGMSSILTLKGKDLIYGKRNNRYGWIGQATKLTENGAIVLFRNGKEQSYSIDTFVQTFCPAHWSKNQGFRVEALAMSVNKVSHLPQPQQHLDICDLGEFYVWRKNGGIPTKTHSTLASAMDEAERLARGYPDQEFLVLSVAGSVCNVPVTTHQIKRSIR